VVKTVHSVACLEWLWGRKGISLRKPGLQKRIENDVAALRKTPRLFPAVGRLHGD